MNDVIHFHRISLRHIFGLLGTELPGSKPHEAHCFDEQAGGEDAPWNTVSREFNRTPPSEQQKARHRTRSDKVTNADKSSTENTCWLNVWFQWLIPELGLPKGFLIGFFKDPWL